MTDADPIHHAFDIVADARTQLLVLGSLPGRQSLDARRYYANPRNQFWRLMSPVTGIDLVPLGYQERLAALLAAGIGLWDVVGAARRTGSLDVAIRDMQPRDLQSALAAFPGVGALAFNGGTAFTIGRRQLGPDPAVELIALPSSSSAHAVAIGIKQLAWARLSDHLH